jgi:hypothetical protein
MSCLGDHLKANPSPMPPVPPISPTFIEEGSQGFVY